MKEKVIVNVVILIVLLWLFACLSASSQSASKDFDERARSFFMNNKHRLDFSPMSDAEKCILEHTVADQLTQLNEWKMVLFYDTFNLKTYSDPYLQLPFSFVENRVSGQFYFLWIPFLRDYLYKINSNYRSQGDSVFVLQEPMGAVKVPAGLIDMFFDDCRFYVRDEASFYRSVRFAKALMAELLPSIYACEISVGKFEGRIEQFLRNGDLPLTNYKIIKETLLSPMFTSEYHRLQVFELEDIGFVLLTYTVNGHSELSVDLYFIASKKRYFVSRGVSTNYRDCFK